MEVTDQVTNKKIGVLLLAGGQSARMGRCKLLLPWRKSTVLGTVLETIRNVGETHVVVLNADYPALAVLPELKGIPFIWNRQATRGQSYSIRQGLRYWAEQGILTQLRGILCVCADQPMLQPKDIEVLLHTFNELSLEKQRYGIVRARYEGRPGNPVLFGSGWFSKLQALTGDTGGRSLIREANPADVLLVDIDPVAGVDMDTPEVYATYYARYGRNSERSHMKPIILVRGGGDIASGIIYRLHRAGFPVTATEISIPTMIRREVSYGNAVHRGEMNIDGIVSRHVSLQEAKDVMAQREVPVVTEEYSKVLETLQPQVVVDAILAKRNLGTTIGDAPFVVGVGPGFTAQVDVNAIVETMRGHDLGRVIYKGSALPNTGIPGMVGGFSKERVIYSPCEGLFTARGHIGDLVEKGDCIGMVDTEPVYTKIAGYLRGILQSGIMVPKGFKLADVDARAEEGHCFSISDKALAVGGGVLEAVLAWQYETEGV